MTEFVISRADKPVNSLKRSLAIASSKAEIEKSQLICSVTALRFGWLRQEDQCPKSLGFLGNRTRGSQKKSMPNTPRNTFERRQRPLSWTSKNETILQFRRLDCKKGISKWSCPFYLPRRAQRAPKTFSRNISAKLHSMQDRFNVNQRELRNIGFTKSQAFDL